MIMTMKKMMMIKIINNLMTLNIKLNNNKVRNKEIMSKIKMELTLTWLNFLICIK